MKTLYNDEYHIPVDLLGDYDQGLLDAETRQEIERHLATCEYCATTLVGVQHYTNKFGVEAFDEYLEKSQNPADGPGSNTHEQGHQGSGRGWHREYPSWMKIAAAVMLLLIPSFFLWKNVAVKSTDELVASHLEEPFPWGSAGRGEAAVLEDAGAQARFAYRSGDYEKTITLIQSYVKSGQATTDDILYRGLSYLYKTAAEPGLAITDFDSVINTGDRFREQAQWYKTLALLKKGDAAQAARMLETITGEPKHYKKEAADELLKSL